MAIRAPREADPLAYLAALRERGVVKAEFEYVGRGKKAERRLVTVEFAEYSPDEIRRMLEATESKFNDQVLEDVDPTTRARIEQRLHDKRHYHSS